MGQQQFILIIIGFLIIAVTVVAGYSQFSANHVETNKDGVTSGLVVIAANAYQYKVGSTLLGGGGNSYARYALSRKLRHDDNGDYTVTAVTPASITVTGTSSLNAGWIATCIVDDSGKTDISYSGW